MPSYTTFLNNVCNILKIDSKGYVPLGATPNTEDFFPRICKDIDKLKKIAENHINEFENNKK